MNVLPFRLDYMPKNESVMYISYSKNSYLEEAVVAYFKSTHKKKVSFTDKSDKKRKRKTFSIKNSGDVTVFFCAKYKNSFRSKVFNKYADKGLYEIGNLHEVFNRRKILVKHRDRFYFYENESIGTYLTCYWSNMLSYSGVINLIDDFSKNYSEYHPIDGELYNALIQRRDNFNKILFVAKGFDTCCPDFPKELRNIVLFLLAQLHKY